MILGWLYRIIASHLTKKLRHRDLRLPIVFAALFLLLQGVAVKGERLSFKSYSAADGLVSDDVSKIVADSRGFLWFCTVEGLSRFDGYRFKNYTQEQGLPHQSVNDLLETADGDYLVATSNGLAVLNPTGTAYPWNISEGRLEQTSDEPPLFKTYFLDPTRAADSPKRINSLAQDGTGQIYAASSRGVYRVVKNDGEWTLQKIVFEAWEPKNVAINVLFTDSRKDVWIGTSDAVYRTTKSGEIQQVLDSGSNSIFEDRNGRMWIDSGGNDFGIRILEVASDTSNVVLLKTLTTKDGFAQNKFTNAIANTKDGRIFVTSQNKLFEYFPDAPTADGRHFKLLDNTVVSATTDLNDNVWFIVGGRGVAKYSPSSFVIYDQRDGVPDDFIRSITSNKAGEVFFTEGAQNLTRRGLDGKFETVVPFGLRSRNWTHNFLDLQADDGEWWVPTTNGLRRYPKLASFADLARTPPKQIYTTADGLFGDGVFAIFEDSRGDIWLSTNSEAGSVLRFERSTQTLHRYPNTGNAPNSFALTFGEDAAGNIWISFYLGELIRYKDGAFRAFTEADGFPKAIVSSMLSDKNGRFWLATASRGLFRIENPSDDAPVFSNFTTRNGLSTDRTLCLADDDLGRIYVGTGRGINRIEPDLPRVKVFTQADGLPGNIVSGCHRTTDGKLWFSSNNSLIRLESQADPPARTPLVFIDSLGVNGNPRSISELGETEIKGLEFGADEKQVQIAFFAISFDTGEALRYQYKLEGQDWSQPDEQRSISLNLSPGGYKFQVRAVNSNGVTSEQPATVTFKINPPFWRTWWFLLSAFLLVAGAVYVLDRYRVNKTRQVENALVGVRESENRFRTLADTASDAILTIDEENAIIFVNDAAGKVFAYRDANQLIGLRLNSLIPDIKSPQEFDGSEVTGIQSTGHEIPLEVSFGEFERDTKTYFTAIARDISERKRAEAELEKARQDKLLELERVRTRIASDLHDDIGSSLTQIAVLTEVARGQASSIQANDLATPLDRIKTVSKELVAVMSDVVWAINPQKDFLHDLIQRMRRFGSDVFTSRGVRFELSAPDIAAGLQLGANIRREVYAIFKESVNNAAKYSDCTAASVKFRIEDGCILLHISDNGKGFDTDEVLRSDFRPEFGGNGLINMRRRANELGGTCDIRSDIGRGTTIELRVPIHS